jgi:hypothetical protein
MEEAAERSVRPLLRLPPLAALALSLVSRDDLGRDAEVDHLEEEAAPRDDALCALLVRREADERARAVRLEDVVQHHRHLRGRLRGRGRHHLGRDRDEGGEELRDDVRERVLILTIPEIAVSTGSNA